MTDQDANLQSKRVSEYRRLTAARDVLYGVVKRLTEADPQGPCGQGPFTGNTRESRRVLTLEFWFSSTRGGSAPVSLKIDALQIEAHRLGGFLEEQTREKIEQLTEEIVKL